MGVGVVILHPHVELEIVSKVHNSLHPLAGVVGGRVVGQRRSELVALW